MKLQKRFVLPISGLALCAMALMASASQTASAPIRVLGIDTGSSWDYEIVPFLSGITFTEVTTEEFLTVRLNRYDVLLQSETFRDGAVLIPAQETLTVLNARKGDIERWIRRGCGVIALAEPIGIGRFSWLPDAIQPVVGPQISDDSVTVVDFAHPVTAGLIDAELSGWGISSHGFFVSPGGFSTLVTDGGLRPITLAATHGEGRVVITDQDPDFHNFVNPRPGRQYVQFVQNAIDWVAKARGNSRWTGSTPSPPFGSCQAPAGR